VNTAGQMSVSQSTDECEIVVRGPEVYNSSRVLSASFFIHIMT